MLVKFDTFVFVVELVNVTAPAVVAPLDHPVAVPAVKDPPAALPKDLVVLIAVAKVPTAIL